MPKDTVQETIKYLNENPGFLETYFRYMQLEKAGDIQVKQLLETMVSANPDMFFVINELINLANEGDEGAKKIILNNLKKKNN
jgi:hypothetical protein